MHDIFHILLLRKYIIDPSHGLNFSKLQILDPQAIEVLLFKILTFKARKLRSREIKECLVQWDKYSTSSSTWEDEIIIRK